MDYGRLLVRSWQLTWRYKLLWLPGLFLALGPVGTAVFRFTAFPQFEQYLGDLNALDLNWFVESGQYWTWLAGGTAIFLMLSLAFWLAWAVAQGTIISAVNDAEAGQLVTWQRSLDGGTALLGRFIAIDAIVFLPLFLLLLLLLLLATGLMLAFTWQMMETGSVETAVIWVVVALACLLPLCCLLLPVGMLTSVFRTLAFRETAVHHPPKVRVSIRRTWQVVRRRWGEILVFGALLWGMQMLLNLLLGGLSLPLTGITAVAPALGRWLGWLVGVATAVPLTIWHTYTAVLWTVVYQEIGE